MKLKQVGEEKIKECSNVLIEFRQKHHCTQKEMSVLLGISQSTISNIELRKLPLSLKHYETVMNVCQNSDLLINALQVQCYKLIKHTLNRDDLKLIKAFILALRSYEKIWRDAVKQTDNSSQVIWLLYFLYI